MFYVLLRDKSNISYCAYATYIMFFHSNYYILNIADVIRCGDLRRRGAWDGWGSDTTHQRTGLYVHVISNVG